VVSFIGYVSFVDNGLIYWLSTKGIETSSRINKTPQHLYSECDDGPESGEAILLYNKLTSMYYGRQILCKIVAHVPYYT